MYKQYLVTGATGFLGRTLVRRLLWEGKRTKALVMKNDPLIRHLPAETEIAIGNVCDEKSLETFFSGADGSTCVIHCAGIVSVASHPDERVYPVNVGGSRHILRYCEDRRVGKLIYVSSSHAIPETAGCSAPSEKMVFSPDSIRGHYAKSKAIATALMMEAAEGGLNVSVVFPTGILGPGDLGEGSITSMLVSFLSGKLRLAVEGGYDFVDVRDAAAGIILCAEYGLPGKGYLLSGHYATLREILDIANRAAGTKHRTYYLPIRVARIAAPLYENLCLRTGRPLYFTPDAVEVLASENKFCRDAALTALGYSPRSLESSVRDTVRWLLLRPPTGPRNNSH